MAAIMGSVLPEQEDISPVHIIQTTTRKLLRRLSRNRFVHAAIADRADLSAFRRPPDLRVIAGVSAITVSYIIGWPLVSLLGAAAAYYQNAALILIGGPVVYGLSHLVFMLGMYLAGAKYSWIFLRWAVARAMIRLMNRYDLAVPAPSLADVAVVAGHDENQGRQAPQAAAPGHALDRSRRQNGDHGKG
jgi:hypothetical protein